MKKTLVFLLVLVMTVCAVFVLVPPVEAEAQASSSESESRSTTYETAYFPMSYLNITQGVNGSYSHQGALALDLAGKDGGKDAVYAPFTGVIKRIYTSSGNFIWLESCNPVIYADGTIDYMTLMIGHDNDVSDLYVGKIIQQGEHFYTEGDAGNATGNHIHLECGKGKYTSGGWYENSYGNWVIYNAVNPYDALVLKSDVVIKSSYGYNWRTETSCDHEYSYELDDYTHWEECTKCGDKKASESHNFDFWRDGNGNIVTTSGGSHGLRCTVCSGTKLEKHSYTCSICDDTCNVCGDYRTPKFEEFVFTYLNDSKHIQKCPECNTTTEELHSVDFTIYYNDNNHWLFCYECNTNVEVSEHNYINSCTECKTCDYTRTATHTYDSDCDTTCNVCGNVRATSGHKYDDKCDTDCNLCGYTRTVTHTYTNSCDSTCNVCGNVRDAGHRYSNACDTSCNYCGETREADHTYSDWTTTQVATCISTGHQTRTCSKCGNTEGKTLDTTTHNFQKTKVDGEFVWKCTLCGTAAAPDYDGSNSDDTPTNDNKNKKSSDTENDDSIKNALIFAGCTVAAIAAGGIGLVLVKRPKVGTPKRAKKNGGSNDEKSDEDND